MEPVVRIDEESVLPQRGDSLFALAHAVGVLVPSSCGGHGKCRECLVEVTVGSEHLAPRAAAEEHLEGQFRLACQTQLTSDEGEGHCHTMRRGSVRGVDSVEDLPTAGGEPTLDPAVTRDGERVLLDGEEIERGPGPLLGLAVDIGTTTVALRLVDLEAGRVLGTQSFENPQRFGGSDVLARVRYDGEHPGKLLRRTLLGYLTRAIEAFDCDPLTIYEVVVAGNPTMRDLFFGLDVATIGQMPYRSVTEHELLDGERDTTALALSGKRSHLPVHPRARVYGMPLIASQLGADAAACLLALELDRQSGGSNGCVGLMDIGTNTELVIRDGDRLHAASCPAGPAFEGGLVTYGMPAMEGAIERVRIDEEGSAHLSVIGEGAPRGLCGSGLVDLLSELLRTGRMNRLGRLTGEVERFMVDPESGVSLSEQDISLLAQAKAANVAGLHLVHRSMGIDFDHLDVLYLAGGFARHLDLAASRTIGLIPDLPDDRLRRVGNATLEGATLALLDAPRRRELEQLVRTVVHVELETFEEFFHFFAEGVQFAGFDSSSLDQEIVK